MTPGCGHPGYVFADLPVAVVEPIEGEVADRLAAEGYEGYPAHPYASVDIEAFSGE